MSQHNSDHDSQKHKEHHILSYATGIKVGVVLFILTVFTVAIAQIDLGKANFLVAMAVATVKASLVVGFFMGMRHEDGQNRIIGVTSLVFAAIFFILTSWDLFYRGDVYVSRAELTAMVEEASKKSASTSDAKFQSPWISTPELVEHGKKVFAAACVVCHGNQGKGDGPAGLALNPPPRNFHEAAGWKKERKPSKVYETVSKGLPGTAMAAFGSLSEDDRWGLAHYVLAFGPQPGADSSADLAAVGIDSSKADGGVKKKATVPIDFMIDQMSVRESN